MKCEACVATFPRRGTKRFCSQFCADVFYGNRFIGPQGCVVTCLVCGERKAVQMVMAKACGECLLKWERQRGKRWREENPDKLREQYRRRDHGRRIKRRGYRGTVEDVSYGEVFERDGWRCGLCGKKVRKALRYPDLGSATLDHIVPLALGGDHTLANVQLAHWDCNRRKHILACNEQLRLVG